MLSGFLTCYWHLEHSSSAMSLCEEAKKRQWHVISLIGIVLFEYVLAGETDYFVEDRDVAH